MGNVRPGTGGVRLRRCWRHLLDHGLADALQPLAELHGVEGLLGVPLEGRGAEYEESVPPAAEEGLEDSRELGVSVVDVAGRSRGSGPFLPLVGLNLVDHPLQGGQALVDRPALSELAARSSSLCLPLAARQVCQSELADDFESASGVSAEQWGDGKDWTDFARGLPLPETKSLRTR